MLGHGAGIGYTGHGPRMGPLTLKSGDGTTNATNSPQTRMIQPPKPDCNEFIIPPNCVFALAVTKQRTAFK